MNRLVSVILVSVLFLSQSVATNFLGRPAAGGSACPDTTYNPSLDTEVGTWSKDPGAAANHYICVDDGRGVPGADFIYKFEDGTADTDTLGFALAGTCDVSKVTVYLFGEATDNLTDVTIAISRDNSNWSGNQTVTMPIATATAERSATFSSLSWTTPANCYVRIATSGPGNFNVVRIYSMQVRVNEP